MWSSNLKKINSSLFKEYGYNQDYNELTIKFNDWREYTYFWVLPNTFKGLDDSQSKGKFFLSNIQNKYTAKLNFNQ